MWPKPQFPAGYVTFTAEILHGELYFFVQYCNCRTKFEFDLNIFFYSQEEQFLHSILKIRFLVSLIFNT